ncbi:MAG: aldehyde dehydrogenase family protein, partial [Polyangiales bacterium]
VSTGRKIAEAAARMLVPVSLELGGKDAAIVLEDADLERSARGIVWGAFNNAGQNCASIERVYVHEKVAAPLIEKMVAFARSLRIGEDVGSLTTKAQLDIVEKHIESAREKGAEVLTGGKRGPGGLLYEPTILKISGDETSYAVIADETFGPVLPVMVVKDEEDAIRRANASRYGLTASVWTKKHARGEAIAEKLRAGVVTINNHGFTAAIAAAPWTGVGESGFGVTNSKHALREMTRPKFVLIDKSSAKSELWWMPYSQSLVNTVKAMAVLRSGTKGIGQKLRALWMLLTNAPKRLMGR